MMSQHYGHESWVDKKIHIDCWLTIGRGPGGGRPSVKVTAGYPSLSRNERPLNLKISLPVALFDLPSLVASINVEAPSETVSIDIDAVSEAVRQVIGMDVDVQVVGPEQ